MTSAGRSGWVQRVNRLSLAKPVIQPSRSFPCHGRACPGHPRFPGNAGASFDKLSPLRPRRNQRRELEHDVFYWNRDSQRGGFLIQASCWERGPAWMTRPYSEDIRERALARADAGDTVRSIAEALQISPSCVTKWKNLRRETGGLSPGKIGGHKKPVLSGANADWLRNRIRSGPFTLRKLTRELAARGIKTDVRAVWTFVHAEGLSFKKNDPASRAGSPRYRP
jgi:putative transposase